MDELPNKNDQATQQTNININFILAGEVLNNKQVEINQFDATAYIQTQSGLAALYSGFPTVSQKTNATGLISFPIQYIPAKNDLVIGIVKIRTSQSFVVDIGAPMDATLGGLEFDGATKRNKPNLKVGSVVFCRLLEYSKHTGGKLSCINKGVSNKKNNQLGELKQGYVFWLPQFKHQLIQSTLLQRIGKCVKFEVAFGKNGRIWVNSGKLQNIMLISNMFKMLSNQVDEQKINALISLLK